jgi:hypothetical protein
MRADFKSLFPICAMTFLAILTFGSAELRAQTTLYSTFGTGQTFGSGGFSVEDNLGWAVPFQPSVTANLTSVDVALSLQSPDPFPMEVAIADDASGSPGATIESFSVTPTSTPTAESLSSILNPVLTGGTTYWFEVIGQVSEPGVDVGQLYSNNLGLTETVDITSTGGASWSVFSAGEPDPAFDVIGAVPEPASIAIAAVGLAGMSLRRRRKSC